MMARRCFLRTRFVAVVGALLTAGCGLVVPPEGMEDLVAWQQQSAASLKGRVKPLPQVRTIVPLTYAAYDLPDPFALSRFLPPPPKAEAAAVDPGLPAPDLTRAREPLEAFALDDLALRGVLEQKGTRWGLIAAPDGKLYRVTVGNYLGKDFGQIVAIEPAETDAGRQWRIVLRELVRDDDGRWRERERELVSQGG
ncbi:pilus assembly protein PilP [Hydrogenophilus thermoluteolus]|uniref:Pilus assembly protein PilP n=1 Tax=Hydrogenophilus thermoluteolus TaxID=297 RepID=A0A2Z6DZJ0_HYDTE|nr:pilus assembly protein PilP [Hydrogenophilus thermoluteolus]BBD77976.1 pilus assembly protein PilP [Hydrogenophilus thermoluteolus]